MTIKIGIIGAGKIVRVRHLPETQMNPHAEVSAVCDVIISRAEELAKEYNCTAYTDYRQMLLDPEIDAVIVAATNTTHAEMTVAALKAGKHVMCEKPMATTLADGQAMLTAAKESGKQLMIAHNQRLEPANIKAREIIQSGKLGRILSFTSVFGHPGCEHWAIDGDETWFFTKDIAGLGVLGDLAVHKLDLMRFILDDNYSEVTAMMGTLAKTYPDGGLIDVEDDATCVLQTHKGAMGTLIASWTYQKEDNSTTIYGEKGVLRIYTDPNFPLIVHFDHETGEYYRLGKKSTNVEQVKSGIVDAFVDALVRGVNVPIPGIEGYRALEAVISCQQAAESGQRLELTQQVDKFV
jgi:UDP-N-acetylglucosamine 3-dehydrogenase